MPGEGREGPVSPDAMVGWMAVYGAAIAKHRLAAMARRAPAAWPMLGPMLDRAVALGGPGDLALAARVCSETASEPLPHYTPPPPQQRVLMANPWLRDRLVRKGDLRCSIVEALRFDAGGSVPSCATLAALTGTTRAAVTKALRALYAEGDVVIQARPGSRRDYEVRLSRLNAAG